MSHCHPRQPVFSLADSPTSFLQSGARCLKLAQQQNLPNRASCFRLSPNAKDTWYASPKTQVQNELDHLEAAAHVFQKTILQWRYVSPLQLERDCQSQRQTEKTPPTLRLAFFWLQLFGLWFFSSLDQLKLITSCRSRSAAISQYLSSTSIPTHFRPLSFAARRVDPEPMKGSRSYLLGLRQ